MKYTFRRFAALLVFIGLISTLGSLLNGTNPVGSVSLVLFGLMFLVLVHD